jgi:hypothetical protein
MGISRGDQARDWPPPFPRPRPLLFSSGPRFPCLDPLFRGSRPRFLREDPFFRALRPQIFYLDHQGARLRPQSARSRPLLGALHPLWGSYLPLRRCDRPSRGRDHPPRGRDGPKGGMLPSPSRARASPRGMEPCPSRARPENPGMLRAKKRAHSALLREDTIPARAGTLPKGSAPGTGTGIRAARRALKHSEVKDLGAFSAVTGTLGDRNRGRAACRGYPKSMARNSKRAS